VTPADGSGVLAVSGRALEVGMHFKSKRKLHECNAMLKCPELSQYGLFDTEHHHEIFEVGRHAPPCGPWTRSEQSLEGVVQSSSGARRDMLVRSGEKFFPMIQNLPQHLLRGIRATITRKLQNFEMSEQMSEKFGRETSA
jgi:hypothetical protein